MLEIFAEMISLHLLVASSERAPRIVENKRESPERMRLILRIRHLATFASSGALSKFGLSSEQNDLLLARQNAALKKFVSSYYYYYYCPMF